MTVTEPPPPVQTPIESTVSMTAGEVLSGSSLFDAASVPNGATITEYWVTAGNPSVGQWDLNGQPVSGAVTPAQLSELTFDALGPGSETIYLQATDNGGLTANASGVWSYNYRHACERYPDLYRNGDGCRGATIWRLSRYEVSLRCIRSAILQPFRGRRLDQGTNIDPGISSRTVALKLSA